MVDLLCYINLREDENQEPDTRFGPFDNVDVFRGAIYGDNIDNMYSLLSIEESHSADVRGAGHIWVLDQSAAEAAIRDGFLKSGRLAPSYAICRVVPSVDKAPPPPPKAIKRRRIIVEGK